MVLGTLYWRHLRAIESPIIFYSEFEGDTLNLDTWSGDLAGGRVRI